jgi:hypothetical protein
MQRLTGTRSDRAKPQGTSSSGGDQQSKAGLLRRVFTAKQAPLPRPKGLLGPVATTPLDPVRRIIVCYCR